VGVAEAVGVLVAVGVNVGVGEGVADGELEGASVGVDWGVASAARTTDLSAMGEAGGVPVRQYAALINSAITGRARI